MLIIIIISTEKPNPAFLQLDYFWTITEFKSGDKETLLVCMISSDALCASANGWSTEGKVSTVEFTIQLTVGYLRLLSYYETENKQLHPKLLSSPNKTELVPKTKLAIWLYQLTPCSAGYSLWNTVWLNKSSISMKTNQQQWTSKSTEQCCWRKLRSTKL